MYYMKDEVISLRINKDLKEKMKSQEEINWSVILRNAIAEALEEEEKMEKRKKASESIDRMRESRAFSKNKKTGTEIIREWRDKRH